MKRVEVVRGDITELQVDAIVNAANSSLLGGGGVDGAIHRKGGPDIISACMEIRQKQGKCAPGQAVITPAGLLRARYVIHTVGPVWRGGVHDEESLLASAYRNSLELARQHVVSRIAFPNISTGAYGFPKDKAAKIATAAVSDFLKDDQVIKNVIFCCFDEENYRLYTSMLNISS